MSWDLFSFSVAIFPFTILSSCSNIFTLALEASSFPLRSFQRYFRLSQFLRNTFFITIQLSFLFFITIQLSVIVFFFQRSKGKFCRSRETELNYNTYQERQLTHLVWVWNFWLAKGGKRQNDDFFLFFIYFVLFAAVSFFTIANCDHAPQ